MISGYDDYSERLRAGESPYTYGGLVKRIDQIGEEIEALERELAFFRDELTGMLNMEWPGGVCPDDKTIIAALKKRLRVEQSDT